MESIAMSLIYGITQSESKNDWSQTAPVFSLLYSKIVLVTFQDCDQIPNNLPFKANDCFGFMNFVFSLQSQMPLSHSWQERDNERKIQG